MKKEEVIDAANKENCVDNSRKSSSDNINDKVNSNKSRMLPPTKVGLKKSKIPNISSSYSEISTTRPDDLKIQSLQTDLNNLRSIKRDDFLKWKNTEKEYKKQISGLNEKIEQLENKINASDELVESIKQEKVLLVTELSQLQDQNDDNDLLESLTIDKEILEEKCEQLQENNDKLTDTIEKLNGEIAYLKNESDNGVITPDELNKYKEAIVQINNKWIQKNQECEDKDQEIESRLEKQIVAEKQLQDKIDLLRIQNNELMQAAISREDLENMVSRLTLVNLEYEEEIESLKTQLDQVDDMSDQKIIDLTIKNQELATQKKTLWESEFKLLNSELEKNTEIQHLQLEMVRMKDEFDSRVAEVTKLNKELAVRKLSVSEIQKVSINPENQHYLSLIIKQKLKEFEKIELSKKMELVMKFIPKDLFKIGAYMKIVDTYVYLKVLLEKVDSLIEQIHVMKSDSTIITNSSKYESSSFMNRTIFLLEVLKPCIRIVINEIDNCEQSELDLFSLNQSDVRENTSIINEHLQLIVQDCYSESRSLSKLEACINYFMAHIMDPTNGWKRNSLASSKYRLNYNKLQNNLMVGNSVYYGCICLTEMIDWMYELVNTISSGNIDEKEQSGIDPNENQGASNSSWLFRIKQILKRLKSQSQIFIRTYEKQQSKLSPSNRNNTDISGLRESLVVDMINIVGAFNDASNEFIYDPCQLKDPVSKIINKLKSRYESNNGKPCTRQHQDIRLKLANIQSLMQQNNASETCTLDDENISMPLNQRIAQITCLEKCANSVTGSIQQLTKNTMDLQVKKIEINFLNQSLLHKTNEINEHKIRSDFLTMKLNKVQTQYTQLLSKFTDSEKVMVRLTDSSKGDQLQSSPQVLQVETCTKVSIGVGTDDKEMNHKSYEDKIRTLREIVSNQRSLIYTARVKSKPLEELLEIKRVDGLVDQSEINRMHVCRVELYNKLSNITIKPIR